MILQSRKSRNLEMRMAAQILRHYPVAEPYACCQLFYRFEDRGYCVLPAHKEGTCFVFHVVEHASNADT